MNGYNLLGAFDRFKPKLAKRHADIAEIATTAFKDYAQDVRLGQFPDKDHSYSMKPNEVERFAVLLKMGAKT